MILWENLRKIGIGKCKLLLSIYQVPTGGNALQWSSAKWSSAPTDRYIDAIHVFFHPGLSAHTHIGSEENSRFSFLCSYLALMFFLNSFELFLRHFQSGCNLSSFEPSSAFIGRSSNCICKWALNMYLSVGGSAKSSGSWFNISKHIWA